jgi:hypothetical protein
MRRLGKRRGRATVHFSYCASCDAPVYHHCDRGRPTRSAVRGGSCLLNSAVRNLAITGGTPIILDPPQSLGEAWLLRASISSASGSGPDADACWYHFGSVPKVLAMSTSVRRGEGAGHFPAYRNNLGGEVALYAAPPFERRSVVGFRHFLGEGVGRPDAEKSSLRLFHGGSACRELSRIRAHRQDDKTIATNITAATILGNALYHQRSISSALRCFFRMSAFRVIDPLRRTRRTAVL